MYGDVFPVNMSNNLWVADFISQFIGYTPSGITSTITHNTSKLISHKPVTSSGFRFVMSWCKLLLRGFRDKLPRQSTLNCLYSIGDQLLVCSLPWYMRVYRPLLSCNNSPVFWLPWLFCLQNCSEQFSCIRCLAMALFCPRWFGLPDNISQYYALSMLSVDTAVNFVSLSSVTADHR
jgi:hypothetical protein